MEVWQEIAKNAERGAERLNARFPNDKTILEAIEKLKKARDAHSKLPIRPRRHRRMGQRKN
jgi:hypothetical protein